MINFHFETSFDLKNPDVYDLWIKNIIASEDKSAGEINFVFCDDDYLLTLNIDYLNHDTLTDIITFDYCKGTKINGDIFISVERVKENSLTYQVNFIDELKRVMAHGILHLCGYGDKSKEEILLMRNKEEEKIKLFHVEQNT